MGNLYEPQKMLGALVKKPPTMLSYGAIKGTPTVYAAQNGQRKSGVVLGENEAPDIGIQINDAINNGLSYGEVQKLLDQRNDKISANKDLEKYKYDEVYQSAQDYINNGKNQEIRNYYDQIAAEQAAAARAKVEMAVGGLEGQKGGIHQSYADLFKQLYIDRERSEKALPQQMAAMGYTGGLTESSAVDIQNGYRDALQQGETKKLATLSDIDRAITDTRLQGDVSIAEQAAQTAKDGLMTYKEMLAEQRQQQNWEKQFGYQQQQDSAEREYRAATDEWNRSETSAERKLVLAKIMAQYGDFRGYDALGIDTSVMQNTYQNELAAQQKSRVNSPAAQNNYKPDAEPNLVEPETVPEGFTQDPTALGFGPIGSVGLAQKLQTGEVVAMNIGGTLYYKRNRAQGDGNILNFLTERQKLFGR